MRKHLIAMVTMSALLLSSVSALANDVGEDMDILAENYNSVLTAKEAATLKKALANMRAAAQDAQKGVPPKLENESADSIAMKDYRHGFDILMTQIDDAMKLADEGKVDEAKAAAASFKATRNEYHKKYR
ncbi:cytochrome b562 [Citrobacter sp. JGM124]|uniref:cytochrome b562 n=1 Tax=Citrobacter sp. JGM124 TaxID=2799789 RepID=UPI001BA73F7F|nr:cytochrome b562 [Citrobacter sp. JGM124]MBS0849123.1 cytochrome b562 [Citrobacter sp. JGM124]